MNLNNKNFKYRLASEKETEELIEFIVDKMWLDVLAYKKTLSKNDFELGENTFKIKNKAYIKKLTYSVITIQEFLSFNVCIYSLSYVEQLSKNKIMSLPLRYLKNSSGFLELNNNDIHFNLNEEKKLTYTGNIKNSGRPNRPTDKSIVKTKEVISYLETHPSENINSVLKKFKFSNSTFYRTAKWLSKFNK